MVVLGENERLWTRVINLRHGDLRESQRRRGQAAGRGGRNGWWKKVIGLEEGSEGWWIWDNLRLKVGVGGLIEMPIEGDQILSSDLNWL